METPLMSSPAGMRTPSRSSACPAALPEGSRLDTTRLFHWALEYGRANSHSPCVLQIRALLRTIRRTFAPIRTKGKATHRTNSATNSPPAALPMMAALLQTPMPSNETSRAASAIASTVATERVAEGANANAAITVQTRHRSGLEALPMNARNVSLNDPNGKGRARRFSRPPSPAHRLPQSERGTRRHRRPRGAPAQPYVPGAGLQ